MFKGLKSLAAGLIAGASLGLLFSPKKGSDLRKTIKDEVEKGGSGLKTVKSAASEFAKDLKKSVDQAVDKIPEAKKKSAKKAVKKAVTKAKKEVSKIKKNLKKK